MVGFELFDRFGGRLKASDRGRQFYEEVRTALDALERLEKSATAIRSGAADEIAVASHPSASISILPDVVARLRNLRPDAQIRMINRTSERVRAVFEAGGADIGIAEGPINMMPGVVLKRFSIACCAILPKGHRLSGKDIITPEDFRSEHFIAMSESRGIGRMPKRVFAAADVPFVPVVISEYFSSICRLVAAGAGVSIVDRPSAETFAPCGLVVRPFEPRIDYEICVFYHDTPPPTPLGEALLDQIFAVLARFDAHAPPILQDKSP
jgi:DNA-binding transcriptional LysR family regulator